MELFVGIARKLASSGYGVFAMDYPGFGLSEGLHGYIPSFDSLVDDVIEHFSKIRGTSAGTIYCHLGPLCEKSLLLSPSIHESSHLFSLSLLP